MKKIYIIMIFGKRIFASDHPSGILVNHACLPAGREAREHGETRRTLKVDLHLL